MIDFTPVVLRLVTSDGRTLSPSHPLVISVTYSLGVNNHGLNHIIGGTLAGSYHSRRYSLASK